MAKIKWDQTGQRNYETGVKNVVLYPIDSTGAFKNGVAWNGVTNISEAPSGAEATPLYADDTKYLNLMSQEDFGATVEAYTYPDEFAECDGSAAIANGIFAGQQTRKKFGLSYRTSLGNDTDGTDHGYKLHLIYNCLASPSQKSYATINNSPEAITFSWTLSTEKVDVDAEGIKPTATLTIDSTKVDDGVMAKIEEALYGTTSAEAYLPTPDEIVELITA